MTELEHNQKPPESMARKSYFRQVIDIILTKVRQQQGKSQPAAVPEDSLVVSKKQEPPIGPEEARIMDEIDMEMEEVDKKRDIERFLRRRK